MLLVSVSYVRMVHPTPRQVQCASHQKSDLARMSLEAREDYECFFLKDRPKYIPMKPEQIVKLSPEDRQGYENSLKINKTLKPYSLRSGQY